jgi:hypothetical protein
MGILAASVRRALAPHLKTLIGPWFAAQFDPCNEVAAAAKSSFEQAFPVEKQRATLLFCQVKIYKK